MATLLEYLLRWRFHDRSLFKRAVGMLSKWAIEWVLIAIPVLVVTVVLHQIYNFPVSSLPHVPNIPHTTAVATILLTSILLTRLHCVLTLGISVEEDEDGVEENPGTAA